MAWLSLLLDLLFLAAAIGWRTWIQWRRTGDSGWRLRGERTLVERLTAGALLLGAVLIPGAAALDLASGGTTVGLAGVIGFALAVAGLGLTVWAQLAMGASWRIGVDDDERTDLVTHGLYQQVRNPIYSAMVLFTIGSVLMLPNALSIGALVLAIAGVELQTRVVEEPYLRRVHGDAYDQWAAVAGRFVPGVGRLADPAPAVRS